MGMDRRRFLQQTGLTLLTWGATHSWLNNAVSQSHQVLASSSNRKLALLVGINQYNQYRSLQGCRNDIEQQQELLYYRFGFQPSDILTLTDESATREQIIDAFIEHLIKQAQPDDIVVFHFSGYGAKVQFRNTDGNTIPGLNTLIPSNGLAQGKATENVLLEHTLGSLARSLATDKVTMVLDTSYLATSQPLQGNLRVRSAPNTNRPFLSEDDVNFARNLVKPFQDRGLQPDNLINQSENLPGVVITATGPQQIATEADWGGFRAGVFTHTLTHALWEGLAASNIQISLTQSTQTIERILGPQQQPRLFGKDQEKTIIPYYTYSNLFGAEAVITGTDEQGTVNLHLTGIPPAILKDYGVNSLFSVASNVRTGKVQQIQLTSRNGLEGQGYLLEEDHSIEIGEGLQEEIRVIPRNTGLIVALEPDLERIERVDATSAFSDVAEVSALITAGEGTADCLFSKGQALQDKPPIKTVIENGYGLFSTGAIPIPSTVGPPSEALKSAVIRLVPKLQILLAAKLCRLTINEGSSRLGLKATLETVSDYGETTPVVSQETFRYRQGKEFFFDRQSLPYALAGAFPQIATGTKIQYRLENISNNPLYCLLLGVDSGANLIGLYAPDSSTVVDPSQSTKPVKNLQLAPKQTRIVPQQNTAYDWQIRGPAGLAEIYVIATCKPMTETLKVLSQIPESKGQGERMIDLPEPLKVVHALQQDLQAASNVSQEITGLDESVYALNVNLWATLSFVYEIV